MVLTQTIPWADFSDKHKRYINAALKNKICVAEGAIRSGKTAEDLTPLAERLRV